MTTKTIITPFTLCTTHEKLESIVAVLQRYGYLSRNQAQAALDLCAPKLPASLTIEQRDKKGSTYITLNGQLYTMNNRARVNT
jgi:hypothetical protein